MIATATRILCLIVMTCCASPVWGADTQGRTEAKGKAGAKGKSGSSATKAKKSVGKKGKKAKKGKKGKKKEKEKVAAKVKPRSLCDIYYPSDERFRWQCVRLKAKDTPQRIFGRYWQDGLRFNRMDQRHFVAGMSVKVPLRMEDLRSFTALPLTYPAAAQDAKFVLVDQSELYFGAYENGRLVYSGPVTVGIEGYPTPNGDYRIDAADRSHSSNLYPMEGTDRPYPMHYALRFFVDKRVETWPAYWLHGRDVPGYVESHGCVGLYDEEMQKQYYHAPAKPALMDAKWLYEWVTGENAKVEKPQPVAHGPRVLITGNPPGMGVAPVTAPPLREPGP